MNKMIVFYADWCGPCKIYKNVYEDFAQQNNIVLERVDIDSNKLLTEQYGVRSVPTTVFFRNGNPVGQITGVVQRNELKKIFS